MGTTRTVTKRRWDSAPNFVLGKNAAVVPSAVVAPYVPEGVEAQWTVKGTDDLRRGDVVRIRAMLPKEGEDNLGDRHEHRKVRGRNFREIVQREERTCVALITRVYRKANAATLMLAYRVLWDEGPGFIITGRENKGGAIGQASVIAENGKPAERRQREYRRLSGVGPTREERQAVDAVAHSVAGRHVWFSEMLETIPDAAALLAGGNPFALDEDGRPTPVPAETVGAWISGAEEPPSWAFQQMSRPRRIVPAVVEYEIDEDEYVLREEDLVSAPGDDEALAAFDEHLADARAFLAAPHVIVAEAPSSVVSTVVALPVSDDDGSDRDFPDRDEAPANELDVYDNVIDIAAYREARNAAAIEAIPFDVAYVSFGDDDPGYTVDPDAEDEEDAA